MDTAYVRMDWLRRTAQSSKPKAAHRVGPHLKKKEDALDERVLCGGWSQLLVVFGECPVSE